MLFIVAFSFNLHAQIAGGVENQGIQKQTTKSIDQLLNADGTINANSNITGSFDASAYNMSYGENGEPIFSANGNTKGGTKVAGDENWSDEFAGPAGTGGTGGPGTVYAIIKDASNNIYVAGGFTTVVGMPANYIAKWDGTTWSALGTGMSFEVKCLAIDGDGNIYAGGYFLTAGGVTANNIAKWDGTTWSALGDGIDGGTYNEVNAIAIDGDGNVYAGGDFTTAGGVPANYIAKWNGTTWSAFGDGMNEVVRAIAIDGDGNVYAGGNFTTAGAVSTNLIAKWNGTAWSALGDGLYGTNVYALLIDNNGLLYAGGTGIGTVNDTGNAIAKWDGTAWTELGTYLDQAMHVVCLATDNTGNIYAGGLAQFGISKWNGTTWSISEDWVKGDVRSLLIENTGNIYAGGDFTEAGDVTNVHNIAKWNGSVWSPLANILTNPINTLAIDFAGNLYVGGEFTTAGNGYARNIAKWDGTTWSALGDGLNAKVLALETDRNGNVYAGGDFTEAGAVSANYIAKWDGTTWSALGDGMNANVLTLAIDNTGQLYAGGTFTTAGAVSANYTAKWNGTTWSALGDGMNDAVNVIATDNTGNLYAAGKFTTAGIVSEANYIAKWNGTTWSALGTGATYEVTGLAVNAAGTPYITFYGAISKWSGTEWTALTTGINTALIWVSSLAIDGAGVLYASGPFLYTTDGGSLIAKWDGTTWSRLGSGIGAAPDAIGTYNNLLYCGGAFLTAGGKSSEYLAKYTTPSPVLNIKGNSVSVFENNTASTTDDTDFGDVAIFSNFERTFTIENTGALDLIISDISINGTNSGLFTLGEITFPLTIPGESSSTITVSYAPGELAAHSATIDITSNFTYNDPYIINIAGTGVKAEQTITFEALEAKTYGDADFTISATASSTLDVVFTSSDETVATCSGTNGTTISILKAGTCSIYSNQAGNDNYNAAPQVSQPLTVNPKAITVTVDANQSKIYGEDDPVFTYSVSSPLVGTDVFTGTITREAGEDVGMYAIGINDLALSNNYDMTFVENDFEITAKAITVTADANQSKVYGETDPIFTYTESPGLETGDSFTGILSRDDGENVGLYSITEGSLTANSNYAITFVSNYFEITEFVEVRNMKNMEISIYPNPSNGVFNVEIQDNFDVTITDISGRVISKIDNFNNTKIDLSTQTNGVYFIKFQNNETVKTVKIIKQ